MVWFLRGICLTALGAAMGVAIYHYGFVERSTDSAPAASTSNGTTNTSSQAEPSHDTSVPYVAPGGITRDLASNGAPADDVQASELKHPLTRSLGQVIESNRELFDQVGAEGLGDSLAEADSILWETKQQNQSALREANRQVRIAGRAPNVVLVVVEGLEWDPAEGLDRFAAKMPALYRIAKQGRYGELASGLPPAEQRLRLTSGCTDAAPIDRASRIFSEALWHSGYVTALIGDAWWWGASGTKSSWDAWLGFPRQALATPFPETVWSNGQPIRLTANAGGQEGVPVRELYAQEAMSFLQRRRRGRPFALVMSLSSHAATPRETGGEVAVSPACADADELLNEIDIRLNQLELTPSTLLLVVGVSSATGNSRNEGQQAPLLVARYLGRLPMDAPLPRALGYEQILPTVLHATASQRVPRGLDGKSQWRTWLTPREASQSE